MNPLPQRIKTELAQLAVFGDKLTLPELAEKLRILAKNIDELNVKIETNVDSQL